MHSEPCPFIPVQLVRGQYCDWCRTCGKPREYHLSVLTKSEIRESMGAKPPTPTRKELELCGAAIKRFESLYMRYKTKEEQAATVLNEPVYLTEHGERVPPIAGDPPCEEYDPAGTGAGVEEDGYPQCANCGHPKSTHA